MNYYIEKINEHFSESDFNTLQKISNENDSIRKEIKNENGFIEIFSLTKLKAFDRIFYLYENYYIGGSGLTWRLFYGKSLKTLKETHKFAFYTVDREISRKHKDTFIYNSF
jgi:hypothetical protein